MPLVVLTGASGAGKTTIAEAIERRCGDTISVFYKDRIGVPSASEMVDKFGSVEGWQQAITLEWMMRLSELVVRHRRVLFEGQSRFSFIAAAAAQAGIRHYTAVLIDCDDETRIRRLSSDRGQPELATDEMLNWAGFLRKEAAEWQCEVLDTTSLTIELGIDAVLGYMETTRSS